MKLTYANKVAINENADIPNVNKVTDDDMNEIKTVVNNNDDDMITINTNLTNATTYSTTEKIVGTWIDGKPIYKKTVAISFPTSSTSSSTYHNISNISMVIFAYIVWYDTTDNKWYINFKDTTGDYYIEFDGVTSNEITIKSGTDYNWNGRTKDRYAILYYTKTND